MVAILVVITILACIGVDAAIQFSRARQRSRKLAPAANPLAGFSLHGVTVPEGVFLDPAHTWVEVGASGRTRIGVDQFLLKAIGHIDEIELPEVGKEIHRGETLFTIRQADRRIEIPAPADGVITAVHDQAVVQPDFIRVCPYDQGWLCSIAPLHLAKDLKRLTIAEEAAAWIRSEVERFQEFISLRPVENMALGTVMQDGGVPADGVLEFMDTETWNTFTFEFVRVHAH